MSTSTEDLPKFLKEKIERNRQKAIILRNSKLISHPYSKGKLISQENTTIKIGATKYKDTGGGFLLEEEPNKPKEIPKITIEEAAIFEADRPECIRCNKSFAKSWLFENFGFKCCDSCRDPELHKLIPRTKAKECYLLKDCDIDKRDPPLRFIKQKNPHNVRWGEMKLYLEIEVEKRALEVWGTEEEIEKERELREEKKVLVKAKRYEKELKALRKGMRSSLYDYTNASSHTHSFGPETYNEEEDTYHHKCTTCPYEETYEKM